MFRAPARKALLIGPPIVLTRTIRFVNNEDFDNVALEELQLSSTDEASAFLSCGLKG